MKETKLDINSRLVGKTVRVLDPDGDWVGEVTAVKDQDTFLVSNGSRHFFDHKRNVSGPRK